VILVGMPDSPYVRRVAISLRRMNVAFEHQQVSVFRHMDRFRSINPVVKAPSFICDDGTVLMDSTLILDHIESLQPPARRLMPQEPMARREALRVIGLALRPPEKQHAPWLDRVVAQCLAAFDLLEQCAPASADRMDAAAISTAVAWRFGQYYEPEHKPADRYPRLVAFSAAAEKLPEFVAVPIDPA
jgi:glutathione S-transferase